MANKQTNRLTNRNYFLIKNITSSSLYSTEALLCRYLVCSKDWDSEARKQLLRNEVDRLEMVEFVENNKSFLGIESDYRQTPGAGPLKDGYNLCPMYTLQFIKPEEIIGNIYHF